MTRLSTLPAGGNEQAASLQILLLLGRLIACLFTWPQERRGLSRRRLAGLGLGLLRGFLVIGLLAFALRGRHGIFHGLLFPLLPRLHVLGPLFQIALRGLQTVGGGLEFRLSPGLRIKRGWLRAAMTISPFAFGMLAQANAFECWKATGPTSVLSISPSRESKFCPEPGMGWSVSGSCQAGSCCSDSRGTPMACTMPFSMRARLASYPVAGTGPSGFGESVPGVARR
jgi:hypothetical protein